MRLENVLSAWVSPPRTKKPFRRYIDRDVSRNLLSGSSAVQPLMAVAAARVSLRCVFEPFAVERDVLYELALHPQQSARNPSASFRWRFATRSN